MLPPIEVEMYVHSDATCRFRPTDNPSIVEYRSLTEYDKSKNDTAKNFIAKQKKFEEIGFLKCIGMLILLVLICTGSDKQGISYILIYGFAYPKNKEQKGMIKLDLYSILDHISEQ